VFQFLFNFRFLKILFILFPFGLLINPHGLFNAQISYLVMRNELLKISIFSLKYLSRNLLNLKVTFFSYICQLKVEQKPLMELLIAACNKCLSFTCILLQRFVVRAHGRVFSDVLIKLFLMADGTLCSRTCRNWDGVD
jgi:hypothetical protein